MMHSLSLRLLALCLLLTSSWVSAQQLSQYSARQVQEANELALNKQFDQAITLLQSIESSREYDQAFISRMLGVFLWQNGQADKAIKHIASAVHSGLLEDEQAWVTEKMLADLYLNDQAFDQANTHYYQLVKSVPDNQDVTRIWFTIAQSHYQQLQWQKVINSLAQYKKSGGEMNIQSYSLKLGSQLQLKQWKQAIPTLETLIEYEANNTTWWRQLVGLQLKINHRSDALNTLALAKLQGVPLEDSDLHLLAQLYAQQGIPERAAIELSELNQAFTDTALLTEQATYWQIAKEWDKAIEVWQLAAEKDNQYYWQAATLLIQQGEYQNGIEQLDRLSSTNKNKQATEIALVKTRALYKLNQYEPALIEAKQAVNIAKNQSSRSQAESWIDYLTQLRK